MKHQNILILGGTGSLGQRLFYRILDGELGKTAEVRAVGEAEMRIPEAPGTSMRDSVTRTEATTRALVDTTAETTGQGTSIAIGADGLPVISYYRNSAGVLNFSSASSLRKSLSTKLTLSNDSSACLNKASSLLTRPQPWR